MLLQLLILFFVPLFSGLLIYLLPKGRTRNYKLLLVFAGAYLFAITVIHILPELYRTQTEFQLIGIFVLAGFFFQQILEHFSSGIEHGHIHLHEHVKGHGHKNVSAIVLLIALCTHAFLEGAMLVQSDVISAYDANAILLGIVLHRAPAAFALATVLSHQLNSKRKSVPYLILFSLAAPVGLLTSSYLVSNSMLASSEIVLLYALVSGNFLHISTTIVFESSPEHHFNARKLTVAILGALSAVGIEYVL